MLLRPLGSLLVLASACGGGGGGGADAQVPADAAPDAAPDPRTTVVAIPATPKRELDLLFVVDDSPAMLDKQRLLQAALPRLVQDLGAGALGLPSLHVGVITTDMGTSSSNDATPGPPFGVIGQGGCSGTGKRGALQLGQLSQTMLPDRFVRDLRGPGGERQRNYSGDLASTIGALTRLGSGGCSFEQPLAALRAALDDNPNNGDFLRAEASLGVVFLTDEDDCSARSTTLFGPDSPQLGARQSFRCHRFGVTCAVGGADPAAMNQVGAKEQCGPAAGSLLVDEVGPYREFLAGLKREPIQLFAAALAAPAASLGVELRPPPGGGAEIPSLVHACSYQGQNGPEEVDPAIRLGAFVGGLGNRGAISTLCQGDLTNGLTQVARLAGRSLGEPCVLDRLADTSAELPGLQVDCVVEDLVGSAATPIEPCGGAGPATCWELVVDPTRCTQAGHLALAVRRAAAPDPSTLTRMRCRLAP